METDKLYFHRIKFKDDYKIEEFNHISLEDISQVYLEGIKFPFSSKKPKLNEIYFYDDYNGARWFGFLDTDTYSTDFVTKVAEHINQIKEKQKELILSKQNEIESLNQGIEFVLKNSEHLSSLFISVTKTNAEIIIKNIQERIKEIETHVCNLTEYALSLEKYINKNDLEEER